jgi:hypothetical protein
MLRLMKRKRNGLFYSKKEETINSISHGIGIAMGVIVSTLFLIKCYQAQNLWAAFGVWLYLFGMGGISADDDLAVEKLTKKLEGLESQQATMKAVNAYFRKHKTLDGCPELTPEQAEKLKADMAQSWHLDKSKPYPAYLLSNNNANIRRVRQRIEELSSRSEFAGWTFPGGEAKINEAENRLQLIFEEKPDADQRQELKSNGFKWAPSQGAWQRQLNQNAIRAAARIDFLRPEDGTSPYQLQPFVKRENKEMSR